MVLIFELSKLPHMILVGDKSFLRSNFKPEVNRLMAKFKANSVLDVALVTQERSSKHKIHRAHLTAG